MGNLKSLISARVKKSKEQLTEYSEGLTKEKLDVRIEQGKLIKAALPRITNKLSSIILELAETGCTEVSIKGGFGSPDLNITGQRRKEYNKIYNNSTTSKITIDGELYKYLDDLMATTGEIKYKYLDEVYMVQDLYSQLFVMIRNYLDKEKVRTKYEYEESTKKHIITIYLF